MFKILMLHVYILLVISVSANPIGILVANLLVPSVVNKQSDIPTAVSFIPYSAKKNLQQAAF